MKGGFLVLILLSALSLVSCGQIDGGRATFPEPLHKKWIDEFQLLHPDVHLNYKGVGSLKGLHGFDQGKWSFAGTDWPQKKT
jgi:ABC-type phosphate transport system substrate-binding protein